MSGAINDQNGEWTTVVLAQGSWMVTRRSTVTTVNTEIATGQPDRVSLTVSTCAWVAEKSRTRTYILFMKESWPCFLV